MASDRALWRAIDRERGLGPRPRAAGRPHVRPRGRGLPDRLYRARRDCCRTLRHRQGNHRADYVGAAAVGRKARRPGQGQGVGRQTIRERRCADATVNFGALKRAMAKALAWTPPIGHADIAPSRHERIEYDGYLTIDAHWIIPALLRSVPIEGRVLEPAAGRGHLSLELRRAGLDVASFDLHRYADPLVHDIGTGDIRGLTTLEGFAWVVTNLPYSDLEELATHLINLGVRDRCGVALLVRTEWIVPKARRRLVHEHPHFAGAVMLTARPRWVERVQDSSSPRHNFAGVVWSGTPRIGDPWLRFAGKPERKPMQLALFEEGK